MKKIFHFILIAAILCGATACTDLLDPNLRNGGKQLVSEESLVTLTFGVPDQVSTKALGEKPTAITSMHVFLFNENGILLAAKPAKDFGSVSDNGANHRSFWSVDLPMGTAERRFHLVANLGADYVPPVTGSEISLMRSLQTTDGKDAYWQRVILPHGISAYRYDGSGSYTYVDPSDGVTKTVEIQNVGTDGSYTDRNGYTVNSGDYIKIDGSKIIDGNGLYASAETSTAVSLVPLVRNFTCIELTTTWSGFTLTRAALINTPVSGYVVPFDDSDNHNKFVEAYMAAGTTALNSDVVKNSGYHATIPSASDLVAPVDTVNGINKKEPTTFATPANGKISLYMYERGVPTENPTSILLAGRLNNGAERWYKIEIANENGTYFPLYRDFVYGVEIKSIDGTDGFETAQEAFLGVPVGDISGSTETSTLTEIGDGNGLDLAVEYIDWTDMGDHSSVRLLYKFTYTDPDNGTTTNLNDKVDLSINGYNQIPAAVTGVVKSTSNYAGNDTPDSEPGWRLATVSLAAVGDVLKKSDVHVEGVVTTSDVTGYAKTLSRDVTYRIMQKQNMQVSTNEISDQFGQPVALTITLPANVFGYSAFPMTLMIEAENNNLNPADTEKSLSVESGTSLFGTGNSFYFLKTIEYSDYQKTNGHIVICDFLTTKTTGNETLIRVVDKEGYLNMGIGYLATGPSFKIAPATAAVEANETSASFTLFSSGSSNQTWTLSKNPNTDDVHLSTETTGTGTKAITVSFPANTTSLPQEYKITASRTGFTAQTFTITQAAPRFEFTVSAGADQIGPDATSVSFDITSTSNTEWTVTATNGATLVKTTRDDPTSVTGTGNATITVNVPALEGNTAKEYTITASCGSLGSKSYTITQSPLSLEFSAYAATPNASETTASFTVTTNSSAEWTITSTNVTSATRSGSTVNVTFPDNLNGTASVTRSVTVAIGNVSKTFTITQAKPVTNELSINTTNSTINSDYVYTGNSSSEVGISFGNGNDRRSDHIRLNPNNGNVTIEAKEGIIDKIVITYTGNDYVSTTTTIVSGNGNVSSSGLTTTWTKSSSSTNTVELSFYRGNRTVRISNITVTLRQ